MKKIKLLTLGLIFVGAVSFAQEDFSFGDFGDDESAAEPTLSLSGNAFVGARAYVDQRDEADDWIKPKDWDISASPEFKLNMEYSGSNTSFTGKLKFNQDSLGDYKWDILDEFTFSAYAGNWTFEAGKMRMVWGKTDKLHVLDNFNANDYTDYIIPDYIERRIAEPMFHIQYNSNSNVKVEAVYTPWFTPDRLGSGIWEPKATKTLAAIIENSVKGTDGKLANATKAKVEAGTKLSVINGLKARYDVANGIVTAKGAGASTAELTELSSAATALIGALQTPSITDKTSLDAALPTVMTGLEASVTEAETAYLLALNEASGFSADALYPDTHKIKYGQAGLRTTFTLGPVDLGFSYYYGRNKQPSVNKALLMGFGGDTSLITDGKLLDYDRLQVFGFEGAYVIPGVGLNTRWEVAYNLTDDIDGDDPTVHNNSIAWVAGFDRDIPIHNININFQTQGKYILGLDYLDDFEGPYTAMRALDVDFIQKNDKNDFHRTNNKLVLDITDSWNYERVKLDLKAIYGIEQMDLLVMPCLTVKVKEAFAIDFSGLYIWCKDEYSEFDGWEHNSFAQIGFKYSF